MGCKMLQYVLDLICNCKLAWLKKVDASGAQDCVQVAVRLLPVEPTATVVRGFAKPAL